MFSDNFLYFFDTSFSRKSIVKFYSHTLCNVYSHSVVTLCNIVVRLSLFLLRLIPKIANKCEVTYSIICSSNA